MAGRRKRDRLTGIVLEQQDDGSWIQVEKKGDAWVPVSRGTAAARASGVEARSDKMVEERPSDRYLKGNAQQQQRTAQQEVQSGNIEHAPIQEPDTGRLSYAGNGRFVKAKPDLYDEMQRARTEEIPVTRTRSGQPEQEPRYGLGERIAATVAPSLAGLVVGAERGLTGNIGSAPARAIAPQGQAQLEELAGRSPVTTPVAIGSAFLPQSLGARAGSAAARLVPAVSSEAPMLMRGTQALGQALMGGAAASGVQATGDATANVQRGMPVGEAVSRMPEQVAQGTGASMVLAPPVMGLQALARGAARNLRQSPDLGPDVVALERAGLTTQTPIPGIRRTVQNRTKTGAAGDDIARAQQEQASSGEPAADITARRAAETNIVDLGARRQGLRERLGQESAMYEQSPEGQARVTTQPVVEYIMDQYAKGTDTSGRPLPGAAPFMGRVKGNLGQFADARLAQPGEHGIPLSEAKRLGFEVPMPPQRPSPAPGKPVGPEPAPDERPTIPDPNFPGGEVPDRLPLPPRVPREQPLPPDASVARIQRELGVGAADALKIQERLRAGETIGREPRPQAPPGKPNIYPEPPPEDGQTMRVPPPRAPEDYSRDPLVVLTPRQLNARELEQSRALYDESVNVSRNKEMQTEQAATDEGVANVLRSLRGGFGSNAITEENGAPMQRSLSNGQQVSGYPALKQSQHERMTALENEFKALGLNPDISRLAPDDVGQLQAAMSRIKASGTTLERLMPGASPEAKRQLIVAAAHQAYDFLAGRSPKVSPSVMSVAGGNPTRTVIHTGGSLRLGFDPLMRAVGGPDVPPGSGARRGAGQASAAAAQVDPALLKRFLGMIGLGDQQEDQKQ